MPRLRVPTIPQLLGPNDVTTETRLVLADAIYFKGTWAEKFEASNTSPQPFTLADGSMTMVDTMNGLMDVKASETADLTLLEIPYQGGDVVMDFFMPTGAGSLTTFETGLTSASLAAALRNLGASGADIVYVPKFTQSTQVELKTVLESMGMTDAFDPTKADFSKMDGAMDLSIGAVVQQARIEVDENGTTAAAATAVDTCSCAVVAEPNTVHIDHPFMFLLRSTPTGSILFMGQVAQPAT
jgi:serpin B